MRHTLEHTSIIHLVQAGVDLPTVKQISGRRTLSMVERYAHQNGQAEPRTLALGAGVVVPETNRVFGGDSSYYYTGTFQVRNGEVTAQVRVRHYAGPFNKYFWACSGHLTRGHRRSARPPTGSDA